MATVINGTYTLRQMIQLTWQFKDSRFDFMKRDVLKKVEIRKVTQLSKDRLNQPTVKYEIRTFSYPSYGNFMNHTTAPVQRKYKHQYDQVLEMETMSLDTKVWKYRLGSQRKVNWDNIPWTKCKTIPRKIMAKWVEERDKKLSQIKETDKKKKEKEVVKIKEAHKKRVELHRSRALYVDSGDFISKVWGVNLDFYERIEYNLYIAGHLYGRLANEEQPSESIPFLPKHALRLIDFLMKKGILK